MGFLIKNKPCLVPFYQMQTKPPGANHLGWFERNPRPLLLTKQPDSGQLERGGLGLLANELWSRSSPVNRQKKLKVVWQDFGGSRKTKRDRELGKRQKTFSKGLEIGIEPCSLLKTCSTRLASSETNVYTFERAPWRRVSITTGRPF